MFNTFAHAESLHTDSTQSLLHEFAGTWYLALPFFVLSVILVALIVHKLTNGSHATTYNAVLAVMFIAGVIGYTLSPPVSVVALSIGFTMALLSVLTMLGSPSK